MIYRVKLKEKKDLSGGKEYFDEIYVDADSVEAAAIKAMKRMNTTPELKLVIKSVEETNIHIIK